MSNPLVQKLESRDTLSTDERQALAAVIMRTRMFRAGELMIREDQVLTESTLILEGFAARTKTLRDGKRQITSVHIGGDFVDLHAFLLKKIDHSIEALTACTVAIVPHRELERITEQHPHLTRMLWLSTVIDAAVHRTWLVAMGRRSAAAQMAHFVCEMFLRLQVIGQTQDRRFRLPLTQMELGDIMGLSSVHVNRVLQDLRGRALLQWQEQVVTILNWDKLSELAEFDPTYLSMQKVSR
jgi:CRP-like cAMP-binding protein